MAKIQPHASGLVSDEAILLEQVWNGVPPQEEAIRLLERLGERGLCKRVDMTVACQAEGRPPRARYVLTIEGREALACHASRAPRTARRNSRIAIAGTWARSVEGSGLHH